jgi:hypothetical protein
MQGQDDNIDILGDHPDLQAIMQEAKKVYEAQKSIVCPFFGEAVTLNADGFYHLTHKPNRQPRNINEQKLKLRLLKRALRVIQVAGTLQEYRKNMEPVGEPNARGLQRDEACRALGFPSHRGREKAFPYPRDRAPGRGGEAPLLERNAPWENRKTQTVSRGNRSRLTKKSALADSLVCLPSALEILSR